MFFFSKNNASIGLEYLQNPEYWEKGCLLGRGSFGEVYLYTNKKTTLSIAVKRVGFDSSDTNVRSFLKALENEVNLLKKLSHKHIVRYLGHTKSNEEDFTTSVCLEFVSGGSL